jgi:hypothetical protein
VVAEKLTSSRKKLLLRLPSVSTTKRSSTVCPCQPATLICRKLYPPVSLFSQRLWVASALDPKRT